MPHSTSNGVNGTVRAELTPPSDQAQLLDTVLSCMAQGVCVVDRSLTVRLMNGRFIEMFALPSDYTQLGRPIRNYIEWSVSRWTISEDERSRMIDDVMQRYRSQPEERIEETWPDGRVVELWRRPLPDGGFVTTCTDITERAAAEHDLISARKSADDANRAKSEFLAVMSHELRTPLNAIIGFSEVLHDERFGPLGDPHYAEYVGDIRQSGQQLLNLINDILYIVKIDAGQLLLYWEPIDLGALLRAELERMRRENATAGLQVQCDLPSDPVTVQADKIRLRQILLNLLANAVKFTPAGGSITVRLVEQPGAVRLDVADTGGGMSDEEIRKALEPFEQVRSALARDRGGTGLGLSIVKQLAELHDGSLDIDSAKGQGTRVSVTLPWDGARAAP